MPHWYAPPANQGKTMAISKNNSESPLIIAQSGPLEGLRWKINGELILGRDATCDVVIPMRQVSRQHARLLLGDDGVRVEDLGSKNGTFLNGVLLQEPMLLAEGDELQISMAQQFIFLSSDATMPLEGLPLSLQKRRLRMDSGARRVWVLDEEIDPPLSASQFNLLQSLYERTDEVLSRPKIIEAVWGSAAEGVSEQALDALVRRLRDRLAEIDSTHDYIVTVRGHGLRLDNPVISPG